MHSRTASRVLMSGARCGIATLVSCALIAPASAQTTQQDRQKPATRTVGSSAIVDSEDIVRNPQQYYGKTVMIQPDDVDRVVSPHVFLLDEDAAFAGPDILVLVPSPAGTLSQGDDVTVTGTVRAYVRTDIERDYDWFDADGLDIDFADRPVIVATSVRTTDGRELAGVITQVPAGKRANAGPAGSIEPGELAENPQQYVGREVTVRAEVEEVYNPQLFTLDEDRMFVGPDVIVYARDGRTSLTEQADDEDLVVTVRGEVRKFIDTELFRTATWFEPWFNDLDAEGRGLVRSRPVIIADSITAESGAQLYTANAARTGSETAATPDDSEMAVGTSGTAPPSAPPSAPASAPAPSPSTPPPSAAPSSSSAAAPARLEVGNTVDAAGTIHTTANDGVFWITMDGRADPVLVIIDPANAAGWKPATAKRVIISGTVEQAPGRDRVYIHAMKVAPANQ